jgi:hypothetical protein
MAGLFEGEGYISIKKPENRKGTSNRHRVLLGLTMTDEDVVRRFAQMAGTGNINGPYPQKGIGTKPFLRWMTSSLDQVERLLNEMWDGLCSRRRAKAIEAMTLAVRDRLGKQLKGASSPGLLPTPMTVNRTSQRAQAGRPTSGPQRGGPSYGLEDVLLPTPRVQSGGGSGAADPDYAERGFRPNLATAVSLLPTPRATDGTKGGPNQRGSSGDLMLPSAVMDLLPTPAARDWKSGQSNLIGTNARPLNEVVEMLLPTPTTTQRGPDANLETREGAGPNLHSAVILLPTPRAQDAKHAESSQNELARDLGKDLLHVRLARHASTGEPTSPPSAAGKPSPAATHPGQLSLDELDSD